MDQVTRAERSDKNLRLSRFAGRRIDDRRDGSCVVDERFVAGVMALAQRRLQCPAPVVTAPTESGVLIAREFTLLVLDLGPLKRHPFSLQICVDYGPVRRRTHADQRPEIGGHPNVEEALIHSGREGPRQTSAPESEEVVTDRPLREDQRLGHRPLAQPSVIREAEHLEHRSLWKSYCWHHRPLGRSPGTVGEWCFASLSSRGDRLQSKSAANR